MHLQQQLDQLQAALRDIAPVVKKYYEYLREQGFSQDQAYYLTKDFQKTLFSKIF